MLVSMWCDALGISQIGIYDNFFELGGHSLLATKIVSRIRQAFQVELPVQLVFRAPTVAQIAAHLVATEAQPGRTLKIALALRQLRQMNSQDRQRMLQQKRNEDS